MAQPDACPLCREDGGIVLWRDAQCRVVRVADPDYPGFCRVIWHDHVREMTDLPPPARLALMTVVLAVEQAVHALFQPAKINLASFGNVVPHLHWHIIPRWVDDRHFPEPVWGSVQRTSTTVRPIVADNDLQNALEALLGPSAQDQRKTP
jgi:diadenosine tetraphosphate (Ap4A) HIT family hydrolase